MPNKTHAYIHTYTYNRQGNYTLQKAYRPAYTLQGM